MQEETGARLGHDGEKLRPGERIQFALRDHAEASSVVLAGIDSSGALTIYDARSLHTGQLKGPAPQKNSRLLDQSIVLDEVTGPERFFVIYGDAPKNDLEKSVRDAAKRLIASKADLQKTTRLDLDAVAQSSVFIMKVTK